MLFRRWGHGHSTVVGVLLGLLLDHHVWTLVLAAFVLGAVAGRLWFYQAMLSDHLWRRWRDRGRQADLRRWRRQPIPYE